MNTKAHIKRAAIASAAAISATLSIATAVAPAAYAAPTCDGQAVTINLQTATAVNGIYYGTEGADVILGTSGNDHIEALGGNDRICGMGGNDLIKAGDGNDRVWGNTGNDTIDGGNGNDRLDGNNGSDALYGRAGNDLMFGGPGNDHTMNGGTGDDTIRGLDGDDRIAGAGGNDRIWGGNGNDFLDGNTGNDTLEGGAGTDKIYGGPGTDHLRGGPGNDRLDGNGGRDRIWGNGGTDNCLGGPGSDLMEDASCEKRSGFEFLLPFHGPMCESRSMNCLSFSGYDGRSAWGFPVDSNGHNCTNYVAFRLQERGIALTINGSRIFSGNANAWDDNAKASGAVQAGIASFHSAPQVGDIAQWESMYNGDPYGHVAYVEEVGNGFIVVSESESGGTGNVRTISTSSAAAPTRYIRLAR